MPAAVAPTPTRTRTAWPATGIDATLAAAPPHLHALGRYRSDAAAWRAVARCRVHMEADTAAKIASGAISKGDVLAVARVAGIQAAKQTPNLLPLCHPLLVGSVYVNIRIDMCKSLDRSMTIGELALWEKTGGRSGTYRRPGGGLDGDLDL